MERIVYQRMAAYEQDHWWFKARRRIIADFVARWARPPAMSRILEAGCGTGGNLAMLARFGPVSAFEPDDDARSWAAQRGDYDIRPGALPQPVPFPPASFDMVVLLDVLEHLDDDRACLATLAARLRPGGLALITVPAFGFLWSRHDESHHHKRRYRRVELTACLREAGLAPLRVTYFNTLLFPLISALRLAKTLANREGRADDELPGPWLNRLLYGLFASERLLLRGVRLPFGVSLLAIAERRE
jgi:SAM-dependent methyltransferase